MVIFNSNTAQLWKHHLFLFKTRDGLNLRVGHLLVQKVMGWQAGGEIEEMLNPSILIEIINIHKHGAKFKCPEE